MSYLKYETPLGTMMAKANDKGIMRLEFIDEEEELLSISDVCQFDENYNANPHLAKLGIELNAYFSGELKKFTVPMILQGTAFQMEVWKALKKIPYGSVASYGEISHQIKNPKAVRAVGAANGANNIAIVIPCHRVIGASGKMTGYAYGIWRKEWLLEHEKKNLSK